MIDAPDFTFIIVFSFFSILSLFMYIVTYTLKTIDGIYKANDDSADCSYIIQNLKIVNNENDQEYKLHYFTCITRDFDGFYFQMFLE